MFHLKSKVFNNVGSPLKAQSSIQAQRLSTMLGNLKAQLVPSTVCGGFRNLCGAYMCERYENAVTEMCV